MAVISVGWLMLYQAHPAAPAPLGSHPGDGWWGWFDQGQYLKITKQLSAGDWFNPDKYYPPLYSAIPAALDRFLGSSEAYFVTDIALCLTFFGGLFLNFKHYLNPLAALGSVVLMYGLSGITYEQWIIPWTTNLSSTLLIWIGLLLNWEYRTKRTNPSWTNKRATAAWLLTGLMIWVRPFEIIPAGVLCIGLTSTQIMRRLRLDHAPTIRGLAPIFAGPGIAFASTIAMYAAYNLQTFRTWEPSYSKTINSMGFSPLDLRFKFISLITDSSTYGINDGHLSHALPFIIPLAALSILSLFFLAAPQKILVIAALTNFVGYLSFNDLVPTGLFTFNNIHYFTWSLAVFGVAAIAALKVLIKTSVQQPQFRRQHLPILAGLWTAITITLMNAQAQPNTIQLAASSTTINCPLERSKTSKIRGKARQYQLNSQQDLEQNKTSNTRLLELNVKTNSSPTQVHLAHQDQIDLVLNGRSLLYRKDWRLVNNTKNNQNLLSILLHQPISTSSIKGSLTIGENSNIHLSDAQFGQHTCTGDKPQE